MSKSQPRKPAIARETDVGGQEELQNSGLGKRLLVPRPAGPGAGYLHGCRSDLEARGPGPSPWTSQPWARDPKRHNRVVTGLHGLQRGPPAASWEPLGGGSLCQKVEEGVGQLGDGEGSPLLQHRGQGPGLGAGSLQELGGRGDPVCSHKGEGSQTLRSWKGVPVPLLCPPPHPAPALPPRLSRLSPKPHGARGQARLARPGQGSSPGSINGGSTPGDSLVASALWPH